MCCLGLRWEEAHHPWSFKGRVFTAEELFDHLISVVTPLEGPSHIPSVDLPVNLPKCHDNYTLWTKLATQISLDDDHLSNKAEIHREVKEGGKKQWNLQIEKSLFKKQHGQ